MHFTTSPPHHVAVVLCFGLRCRDFYDHRNGYQQRALVLYCIFI